MSTTVRTNTPTSASSTTTPTTAPTALTTSTPAPAVTSASNIRPLYYAPTSEVVELRRFNFTESMKLLLLQCVPENNAHRSAHSQQDKSFEDFLKTILPNIPENMSEVMQKPGLKTLRDKFRMTIGDFRSSNKRNETASGNLEVVSEVDQLLDAFILENDDDELDNKKQKDKLLGREAALVRLGEEIRAMALKRKVSDEEGSSSANTSSSASDIPETPRAKKAALYITRNLDGKMDHWNQMVREKLIRKRKIEADKSKQRKAKLEINQRRWAAEQEEREHLRSEREAHMKLIHVLINKLNSICVSS